MRSKIERIELDSKSMEKARELNYPETMMPGSNGGTVHDDIMSCVSNRKPITSCMTVLTGDKCLLRVYVYDGTNKNLYRGYEKVFCKNKIPTNKDISIFKKESTILAYIAESGNIFNKDSGFGFCLTNDFSSSVPVRPLMLSVIKTAECFIKTKLKELNTADTSLLKEIDGIKEFIFSKEFRKVWLSFYQTMSITSTPTIEYFNFIFSRFFMDLWTKKKARITGLIHPDLYRENSEPFKKRAKEIRDLYCKAVNEKYGEKIKCSFKIVDFNKKDGYMGYAIELSMV